MNTDNIAKLLGALNPIAELVFLGAVEMIPVLMDGLKAIHEAKAAGRDVSQAEMDRVQSARQAAFAALVARSAA